MAYANIQYRLDIYKGYDPNTHFDHTEYFPDYETAVKRYWELYSYCSQRIEPQLYKVVNCKWVRTQQPDDVD